MNTQKRAIGFHGDEIYGKKKLLMYWGWFLLVITLPLSAQNNQDYSPKTPEAAAFEQVAEIPVGHFTGTPNISIPLYTIEEGDLQLPITLDYLGTAIRVDQEATWVGLNWLLNAGGAITTQLSPSYNAGNTYPNQDKDDWNYLMNSAPMTRVPVTGEYGQKIAYKIEGQHPNWCGSYGKNWFSNPVQISIPHSYNGDLPLNVYTIALTYHDGKAPTYHATFLGHHICFVWDRIKDEFFITGEPEQGFKVSGSIRSGLTITDGNGTRYEFSAIEVGHPVGYTVNMSTTRFDQTFYLTKILSPTGHSIRLDYKDAGITTPVYKVSEQLYQSNFPTIDLFELAKLYTTVSLETVGNGSTLFKQLSPYYNLQLKRLDKIVTDHQVIRFVKDTEKRRDINGDDHSLQKIEVYNKTPDGQEKLLKRFRFEYSYSSRNNIGGNTVKDFLGDVYSTYTPNGDDFMYCRLMLNDVWEEVVEGNKTIKKPSHHFTYTSAELPCKASAAVDFWGYYNGKENYNGKYHTLIPRKTAENTYDGVYNFPDAYLSRNGADRSVDKDLMKAGMLTAIQYPTGAIMSLTYEPHTFGNYNYFSSTAELDNLFQERTVFASPLPVYPTSTYTAKDEIEFTVNTSTTYKLNLNFQISHGNKPVYWRYLSFGKCLVQIFKYRDGTNYIEGCSTFTLNPNDTIGCTGSTILQEKAIELKRGSYKMRITAPDTSCYPDWYYTVTAKLSFDKTLLGYGTKRESIGGGLRIKEITTCDGSTVSKTSFDYRQEDNNSSGMLMAPAVFARQKLVVYQSQEELYHNEMSGYHTPSPPQRFTYWIATGSNMAPLPSYNNAYSRVAVSKSSGNLKSGKSVFEYYLERWAYAPQFDFMQRIENPKNGKLLVQSDYDSEGNIVRKVTNTYSMTCVDSRMLSAVIENIYVGPNKSIQGTLVSDNPYADALQGGCMQIYLYPSVQFAVNKVCSKESEYMDGHAVENTKDTEYNQYNHLPANISQSTSRKGELIITEALYPTDYTNLPMADSLVRNNIVNVPIETITSATGKSGRQTIIDDRIMAYSPAGLLKDVFSSKSVNLDRSNYVPSNVTYSLTGFEMTSRMTYNNAGRPRMTIKKTNDVTTYIWGYKNQYPIAVIKGVRDDVVIAALGGAAEVSTLEECMTPSISPEILFTQLSGITGAQVTVFDYLPCIGMTKMIAPNGETTRYEYDAYGRLSKVIDHNGVVIKQYEYNFKRK